MIKASEAALYVIAVIIIIGMVGVALKTIDEKPSSEEKKNIAAPIAIIEENEIIVEEDDEEAGPKENTAVASQGGKREKSKKRLLPKLRNLLRFSGFQKNISSKTPNTACPAAQQR